ncbi:hypothetical protein CMUS01_06183 [Colletotrichum musicola]|uniref:Impact N-terminal domain-containing protein n=1 Tax=Colletotrichum musicola TaxID=2175873 RepID=A0A8H6NJ09_9PEZI|nr:hypothetical protein CMUS01_06183 [Colletotrichum musicola]
MLNLRSWHSVDTDMASQQDLQELLRLITARRVPMITAMGQVKALQAVNLRNIQQIADAQLNVVEEALSDAKKAKSLHSACRAHVTRPTIKRSGDSLPNLTARKRARTDQKAGLGVREGCENDRDGVREDTLCLPVNMDEGEIETTAVHTNRAPLMLAFAVELLRYTMPEQPLSSRLSLAKAVVSANSRSKAVSLGIADSDGAANDRFWGEGQPKITIMGSTIAVLKRGDYQLADGEVLPVTASYHDNHPPISTAPRWVASRELSFKSSTFVARIAPLGHHSQAPVLIRSLLASEPRLQAATHNVWAYRVGDRAHKGGGVMLRESCEDDGETGCGEFILQLMREAHIADAVVVLTRWFGGDMLGPARWRIIRECVTEALSERMRLPCDQVGNIGVALWALDLQRMNKSAVQAASPGSASKAVGEEIHRPESARAYLSKSFASPRVSQDDEPEPGKIPRSKDGRFEHPTAMFKDRNLQTLARVLGALRLLYESWAAHLTASEMDQRAWSWYVAVRPEIDPGPSGWGAKGWVQLSKILDLRRKS